MNDLSDNSLEFRKSTEPVVGKNSELINSILKLLHYGFSLHQAGHLDKAKTVYENILLHDAGNFDALQLLGTIATQEKNWLVALDFYEKTLIVNPSNPFVFCNQGIALKALNHLNQALSSYDNAIKLKPDYAEAHYNRGIVLNEINRLEESIFSYDKAIEFKYDYWDAYYNRGLVLHKMKRLQDAVASYNKTLEYKHDHFEAYCNRGIVLNELNKTEQALADFNNAIDLKPDYSEAFYNRGKVFNEHKLIEDALDSYDKAIALHYDFAEAHHNKSLCLLLVGKFEEGFKEYEWRWRTKNFTSHKITSCKPEWLPGHYQNVLVWAEQGIGDEIMFGTLLEDFRGHGVELIVEADERLLPLYQRSMPEGITFVSRYSNVPETAYDSQISMASLCQYLRNYETHFLQARKAFLKNDSQRTQRIRSELALQPDRLICGISWQSQNTDIGGAKSIQLDALIRHLDMPECQWVNLQYGDMTDEIAMVKTELGVEIVQYPSIDNRMDMDGLASLIGVCDVVISISNTTVHLAGALGKEVHVMLPFSADWRWQHNRSDSIWYPNVNLYRQPTPGDWVSVFSRLRVALVAKQASLS